MSGTGALIETDVIPVSAAAAKGRGGLSPLDLALYDGEDYELLLTVPARKAAAFERAWGRTFTLRISRLGVMTAGRGRIECVTRAGRRTGLKDGGYEHFIGRDPRSG
jgi:thiamine-monophosphate kinase